ncbi:MAG: Hsp33 family molecular chaperone HslO [Clostridia bacterium]|nr:Hsp33 family molecular chaperone HslO [Clostridia bacterium]
MAKIIRAMTQDGSARAFIIQGRDIVNRAIEIHHTAPTATAALGRVLLATSLMGSMMGEKEDALTLRFQGDGEGGTVLASSDYSGNVRGLIGNPDCDLPLRESDGKLDVGKCIGNGYLTVIRDAGGKEPWQGTCEIRNGEVAQDIAYYYAFSEQVPTLCALGVLVDVDYSCKEAGGIIIQLLPFADEAVAEKLEENAKKMPPITTALQAASLEDILAGYLDGIPFDIFDEFDCEYRCDCSRDRTDRALISLGKKQLRELIDDPEETMEMTCRFCDNIYKYSKDDLKALLESL